LKSVKIRQSYRQSSGPQFFLGHSVHVSLHLHVPYTVLELYIMILAAPCYWQVLSFERLVRAVGYHSKLVVCHSGRILRGSYCFSYKHSWCL